MTNNGPYTPIPRRGVRPTITPVSKAMQAPSPPQGGETSKTIDPRLARLQIVSVDRIEGSRFQHRDELNVAEDREYQTLLNQVRGDIEAQPNTEMRTIETVFPVMPDPESEEKLILCKGGHRRFQVCLDLGIKEVCVWIKDYDEAALATGTYQENKGRRKTNWLEDAQTFKDIHDTLGWTQTQIAQRLHVEGGQPHVSRVLAMLDYHPDLQRMIAFGEERGMRAAKALARLQECFGAEKARELWTPLIAGFKNESLTTDDVETKVKQLLGEVPERARTDVREYPLIKRVRLAKSVRQKWQSFRSEMGDGPLDDETRTEVEAVYQEMGTMLGITNT